MDGKFPTGEVSDEAAAIAEDARNKLHAEWPDALVDPDEGARVQCVCQGTLFIAVLHPNGISRDEWRRVMHFRQVGGMAAVVASSDEAIEWFRRWKRELDE